MFVIINVKVCVRVSIISMLANTLDDFLGRMEQYCLRVLSTL